MLTVCDIENPLGLSWNPDAKRVFFAFTDEVAQSYGTPAITYTHVLNKCWRTPQTTAYIWDEEVDWQFGEIASRTGGALFKLSPNSEFILDDLNTIMQDWCLEQ